MKKILFHYRKWYEYIIQPLANELGTCANVVGKKIKMYTELPKYRIVVADRCSRNLEPPSHPPIVVYMSQTESLRLL
jgi:hypothetical protein